MSKKNKNQEIPHENYPAHPIQWGTHDFGGTMNHSGENHNPVHQEEFHGIHSKRTPMNNGNAIDWCSPSRDCGEFL